MSLSVTDLINILFVDVPDPPADDDDAEEETEQVVLPSAGQNLSALAGSELSACATVEAQFKLLKRSYFHLIRHVHPDKGGDAPTFRRVQEAFQHLRALYDATPKISSFTDPSVLSQEVASAHDDDMSDDDDANDGDDANNVQPWEFYEAAATADDPLYRVELAKSGNARCTQTSATYRRCTQEWEDKKDKKTQEVKPTLVNPKIAQGEVRVGSYEDKTGKYTRFCHLECWRVPSKVWLGLPDGHLGPQGATEEQKASASAAARASLGSSSASSASSSSDDADSSDDDDDDANDDIVSSTKYQQYASALTAMNEVYITGFSGLPKKDRKEFVLHVMNRCNWARYQKPKKKKAKKGEEEPAITGVAVPGPGLEFINDSDMEEDGDGAKKPAAAAATAAGGADMLVAVAKSVGGKDGASAALAVKKAAFVVPVPGVGKGVADALDGFRFVLTGIFPELGGGSGLGLGKKKAENIITSFGGKVTGSISGKTNYLLVGKEPGMSKVKKANQQNVQRLNLDDLKNLCEGGSADDIKPLQITSFSSGFGGRNGLALEASATELTSVAAAHQSTQPMITNGGEEEGAKPAAAAATATAKKSKGGKAEAKKPAAKKGGKTKKQLKDEAKAAASKKAADDKAERKSKLAKATKIKETAIEDLDLETLLEAGDLDKENVDFLKKILRHLKLKVSGKKAELLSRLREHAGLDDPMDEDDDEEEMDVDYEDAKPSASSASSSSEEETFDENEGHDMHYFDDDVDASDDDDSVSKSVAKLRPDFSAEVVDEVV